MSRRIAPRLIIAAALIVVAACQDTTTPLAPVAARVTPAAYPPQQVQRWFDVMAREGLALPGTVLADYDETTNRVVVGVEHAAARANVRALAARLGVPAEVLVIREMEPISLVQTLRDRVDPRIGGIQIHFGNFLCSMGFNAVDGGQASFVTASHCTNQQGGVEGTVYYQPLQSVVNVSGSSISQICQTIVENSVQIVGGGDSGSPVYTSSNALAGVLWGGNSSGTLLVFSPLKNVQDELGPLQVN